MSMRCIVAVLVLAVLTQAYNMGYAAPVGNVTDSSTLKNAFITKDKTHPPIGITAGEETDFIYDRKVEDYGYEGDSEYTFVGTKIGAILFDLVTIYGIVGRASCKNYYTDEGMSAQAKSEPALAWGVGCKATLYEFPVKLEQVKDCVVRFGVDGRYRSANFDIDKVAINGQWYYLPDTGMANVKLKIDDWQAACALSVQIGPFIPYCGLKYSDFNANVRVTVLGVTYDDDSIEPANNLGFFVGADVIVLEYLSLNIEGRFNDETALTLGCTLRM